MVDEELCANGRPYIGRHPDPGFYKYDMDDAEWYGYDIEDEEDE